FRRVLFRSGNLRRHCSPGSGGRGRDERKGRANRVPLRRFAGTRGPTRGRPPARPSVHRSHECGHQKRTQTAVGPVAGGNQSRVEKGTETLKATFRSRGGAGFTDWKVG